MAVSERKNIDSGSKLIARSGLIEAVANRLNARTRTWSPAAPISVLDEDAYAEIYGPRIGIDARGRAWVFWVHWSYDPPLFPRIDVRRFE